MVITTFDGGGDDCGMMGYGSSNSKEIKGGHRQEYKERRTTKK